MELCHANHDLVDPDPDIHNLDILKEVPCKGNGRYGIQCELRNVFCVHSIRSVVPRHSCVAIRLVSRRTS